jgi:Ca-activated chloride channel family protein
MRLAAIGFLFLLLLIPLAHKRWKRRNKPARVRFSLPVPAAVARVTPFQTLLAMRYLAFALLVFALARPQFSFRQTERNVSGIDIFLSFDISRSMDIEDMSGRSRLDVARETIENFIKRREHDRIGLIVFSGEAVTMVPPTLDTGLLLKAVSDAEPGSLRDGTAIGDGLATAVARMKDSKAKSKIIILLTDGKENVGQVGGETAGELARGYGLKVYTIGIGQPGKAKLPIRQRIGGGKSVVTSYQWMDNEIDLELLEDIARKTGGKFYHATDGGALEAVFNDIDQLEKTEIKSTERVRYEERYSGYIAVALMILMLEQFLSRSLWRVVP